MARKNYREPDGDVLAMLLFWFIVVGAGCVIGIVLKMVWDLVQAFASYLNSF